MNRKQAYAQFVRMVVTGSLSTAVAILFVRHTGHWWMGCITGVPLALLACDIKKSVEAIKFVRSAFVESARDVTMDRIKRFVTLSSEQRTALKKHGSTVIHCGLGFLSFVAQMCEVVPIILSTTCVIVIMHEYTNIGTDEPEEALELAATLFGISLVGLLLNSSLHKSLNTPGKTGLHLTASLHKLDFFKSFDKDQTSAEKLEEKRYWRCVVKDEEGLLLSMKRLRPLLWSKIRDIVIGPFQLFLFPLLFPLMALDALLYVFLKVAVTRSVSLAIGVLIGFSIDYLFAPHGMSVGMSLAWLIACSLLGGVSGWFLWLFKMKEASFSPDLRLAEASS